MSVKHQSLSLNSSTVSSQFDNKEEADNYRIKNHVRDKLKSRIFLGRYVERRLADKEIGYRDVVVISPAEVELKADLIDILQKLRTIAPNIRWIGITVTDTTGHYSGGVCLWTEIDNQIFGPFWFQIKSLKFRDDEIIVMVQCLRHISDAFLEIEPILTGTAKTVTEKSEKLDCSVAPLNETYIDIVETLKSFVSITNVREFITVLFAFVIAIFTGSTSIVNFLGNFILALLRELSIFIKNSTPMFLGILDFFSKIIGGFYILLAMLFKQSAPITSDKRSVQYYNRSRRNHHQYDDNQFD